MPEPVPDSNSPSDGFATSTAGETDLRDSLVVMDIADRLRRRDTQLDQASDVAARRQALKHRLRQLYARQHIAIDDDTLEQAIDQRLDQRLTYRPARGLSAWLARAYVGLVSRS